MIGIAVFYVAVSAITMLGFIVSEIRLKIDVQKQYNYKYNNMKHWGGNLVRCWLPLWQLIYLYIVIFEYDKIREQLFQNIEEVQSLGNKD